MESGKGRTQRDLQKRDGEVDEDGAALLSAGLGDGAHGRNLVALSAQLVFSESRESSLG
jgi:hypothetical protein